MDFWCGRQTKTIEELPWSSTVEGKTARHPRPASLLCVLIQQSLVKIKDVSRKGALCFDSNFFFIFFYQCKLVSCIESFMYTSSVTKNILNTYEMCARLIIMPIRILQCLPVKHN